MREITISTTERRPVDIVWVDPWEGVYRGQPFYVLGGQPELGYLDLLIGGKRVRLRWQVVEERYLARVQLPKRQGAQSLELRSPMPGLVKEVRTAIGELVEPQQGVMVLEAMKMENILFAPVRGRVEAILVSPGQAVEKGALLMRFAADAAD